MQLNWDARKKDAVFVFAFEHSSMYGWVHKIQEASYMPNSKLYLCHISMHWLLLKLKGCPPVFLLFFSHRIGSKGFLSHMHVQIYCNFFCTSSIAVTTALYAMSLFSGQQASVLCLLFVSVVYKGIALPTWVYVLFPVCYESTQWFASCAKGSMLQSLRFYGKWYLEFFVYIGHCGSDQEKGSWLTSLFLCKFC